MHLQSRHVLRNRLQMHLILLQSRLCYRTDSAIEPCYRAALNVQCTDCPSSPATEQTSHHVYRFRTALLQSRLRRTCSIHISHESAVKGLQKKCCDERNVFIVIGYSIVNLSSQPCLANIKIAEAVLGSPCIYFRHSFYMYFSQGDAFTRVIVHACTLAIV